MLPVNQRCIRSVEALCVHVMSLGESSLKPGAPLQSPMASSLFLRLPGVGAKRRARGSPTWHRRMKRGSLSALEPAPLTEFLINNEARYK